MPFFSEWHPYFYPALYLLYNVYFIFDWHDSFQSSRAETICLMQPVDHFFNDHLSVLYAGIRKGEIAALR